ncbi:MAG: PEP-CTERM sorting domain-containing protein [Phycisphaerales bacterium]|nr:PEP-CTERM sorting domain-containing protein [Phycisphaerales bacterium]
MNKGTLSVALVALLAGAASADVYSDNTGNHLAGGDVHDFFYSQGFTHLDITMVEVTNDANFIYFDIHVDADIDATNWGKYIIGLDTGRNAGDNSTDPGSWNRNVDWGRGITDFVGSWADDGGSGAGGELRSWDGAAWNLTDATYAAGTDINADDSGHASGIQRIGLSLASLGLSVGDTIEFDVFATGGGADPGVDHLSRSDFATDDWANQSTAGDFLSYTIIPAPGSMALLGLGGLAAARRRR